MMKALASVPMKTLDRIAILVSVVVLALVVLMRRVKLDIGFDFYFLPPLHAILNTATAVLLVVALVRIRRGHVEGHRRAIMAAIFLSLLFLLSYVVYHFTTEVTTYCGDMRGIYFFFLITHVILAAVILPFILFTFNRAVTGQFGLHRRMARWVFPIWLYVAVTGPICYLMLAPCYGR